MVKVIITKSLLKELRKKFSDSELEKILNLIESLEKNPHKGKALSNIGGIIIKELKYNA